MLKIHISSAYSPVIKTSLYVLTDGHTITYIFHGQLQNLHSKLVQAVTA